MQCVFCNKIFKDERSTIIHIKKAHEGIDRCPVCDATIRRKGIGYLRNHLTNKKDEAHIRFLQLLISENIFKKREY
jgi:uncharacterized C2H2 Zn-finger protein